MLKRSFTESSKGAHTIFSTGVFLPRWAYCAKGSRDCFAGLRKVCLRLLPVFFLSRASYSLRTVPEKRENVALSLILSMTSGTYSGSASGGMSETGWQKALERKSHSLTEAIHGANSGRGVPNTMAHSAAVPSREG